MYNLFLKHLIISTAYCSYGELLRYFIYLWKPTCVRDSTFKIYVYNNKITFVKFLTESWPLNCLYQCIRVVEYESLLFVREDTFALHWEFCFDFHLTYSFIY